MVHLWLPWFNCSNYVFLVLFVVKPCLIFIRATISFGWIDLLCCCCCGRASTKTCYCKYIHNMLQQYCCCTYNMYEIQKKNQSAAPCDDVIMSVELDLLDCNIYCRVSWQNFRFNVALWVFLINRLSNDKFQHLSNSLFVIYLCETGYSNKVDGPECIAQWKTKSKMVDEARETLTKIV